MPAQPRPGGDELRIRAYLRALNVRPFGHAQDPPKKAPMTDKPILPTRVIPAGTDLPARPPAPGEAPPWRTPPPPPPAPPADPPRSPWPAAPAPGPVEVRVTVDLAAPDEPEPEQSRWSRLWETIGARIRPWKLLIALAAAVFPIPWTGYSPAVTWHYTVTEARALHLGLGYAVAFGAFGLAVHRLIRGGGTVCLFCCAVTFIGLFGAMSWYDPIHWLTGVAR